MVAFLRAWKKAWLDSLSILTSDQRASFVLITLKTIMRSYKTLLVNFWWLCILYGASFYFLYTRLPWVSMLLSIAFVSLSFLAVRPSLERKSIRYFLSYIAHDYEILFLFFLFPYLIFSGAIAQWYTLFFIYLMFFILDSGALSGERYGVLKAIVRTLKILLSNMPILLLMHGLFILLFILMHHVLDVPLSLLMIGAPIPLSWYSTIYIKRVHEQLNLYC